MIVKTTELSNKLRPYFINLNGFRYSNEYFKSLFVDIDKTDELINANLDARNIFK